MRESEYWAEQSTHISKMTIGCCVCNSPYGGFASNGRFYCWYHMPKNKPFEGKIIA